MKSVILTIIILAAAVISSSVIRRFFLDRLSRQLYEAAYVKKDKELFEILIASPQARMLMSDVSRDIMSLNFRISMDDREMAVRTAERLLKKKLNLQEAQSVYPSTIAYLCEKEDTKALDFLTDMKNRFQDSKDLNTMLMLYDCELTYDVYIRKDAGRIRDLEELISTDIDPENKAVYQYRLAKLYHHEGDKEKAVQLLNEAKDNTKNDGARKKIDRILSGDRNRL